MMYRFPKIKYPNDPETDGLHAGNVVVTEKLDGANFRFTWDENGNIVSGSRNVEFHEDGEALPLDEISVDFRHAIAYLRETIPDNVDAILQRLGYDPTSIILYGEAMQRHSLEYEDIEYGKAYGGGRPHPVDDTPNVVIFDAMYQDCWLDWDLVEEVARELRLPTVPVLERGSPDDLSFDVPEESMFGGPPEGIVARRLDGSVRAKKVTEDFKETNATEFNDPSKAASDAAEFVAMFVTDARVENIAHSLVDDGEYDHLQMPMMEDLPLAVLRDVMEEEGGNLLLDEYGFECEFDSDFKSEVRSKASKKCARVLKSLCQEF